MEFMGTENEDHVVCQNTIEPFRGPDIDKYEGHTSSMIPDHGR